VVKHPCEKRQVPGVQAEKLQWTGRWWCREARETASLVVLTWHPWKEEQRQLGRYGGTYSRVAGMRGSAGGRWRYMAGEGRQQGVAW